jgi:hypothetical protein
MLSNKQESGRNEMSEEDTTQVQVVKQDNGGMMTLKQVADRVNLIHEVLNKVMVSGTHYGTVPGCGSKPVLLKAGADVLAMTFRLVPQFKVEITRLDNGHREYDVTCSMFTAEGVMVGQGVGSGTTMEKKYRYRKDDGGRRIENEDIADVYNTVLKMAKKRSHIDATLTVTGAADIFTQDLISEEDIPTTPKQPEGSRVESMAKKFKKEEPKPDTNRTPSPKSEPTPTPPPAESDNPTITGVVEAVSGPKGKSAFGLCVEGNWYGSFDKNMVIPDQGDKIVLTYKENGKYRNVVSWVPVDGPHENQAPTPPADEPSDELRF